MITTEDRSVRWWQKVIPTEGCWHWIGAISAAGYGVIAAGNHKVKLAHRVGYEMLRGPIQPGMTLDHLCRNTKCVNPHHLEIVTHRTNVLRGASPFADKAKQTHCCRGHAFTPENTRHRGTRRACRKCDNMHARISKARTLGTHIGA